MIKIIRLVLAVLAMSALIEGARAQFFIPSVPYFYSSTVGTPCTAGATDLSLTTGCNLTLYHGVFF